MSAGNSMSLSSLFMASSLILISLLFSYHQKLKLEKEIIIGVFRAVIQLAAIGYILNFVFGLKNPLFTTFLLIFMMFNASINASKRGKSIKNSLFIAFISIASGTALTLSVLIFAKAIKYEPFEIIPIGGMVISNAMVAIGLCYKQLISDFQVKRQEVETKLALGADILLSSKEIIKNSIKTGILPTIDSMKTLGIVSLPGTMTGLILAGTSPIQAIKFQIMVTFMLSSTTSIAAFICCYLSYKKFFTARKELKNIIL
jgi:putative ABC transport system permease protein